MTAPGPASSDRASAREVTIFSTPSSAGMPELAFAAKPADVAQPPSHLASTLQAFAMPPAPMPTIVAVTPPPRTWSEMKVLVPQPGLCEGQEIMFDTPAKEGLPAQSMSVRVQGPLPPGSTITVLYPNLSDLSGGFQVVAESSPLMPSVRETMEDDRQAMQIACLAYASGLLAICYFFLFGFKSGGTTIASTVTAVILWVAVCTGYFCQPKSVRARRPRQCKVAYATLITMLGFFVIIVLQLLNLV